jgi:hypothetical protein
MDVGELPIGLVQIKRHGSVIFEMPLPISPDETQNRAADHANPMLDSVTGLRMARQLFRFEIRNRQACVLLHIDFESVALYRWQRLGLWREHPPDGCHLFRFLTRWIFTKASRCLSQPAHRRLPVGCHFRDGPPQEFQMAAARKPSGLTSRSDLGEDC